SSVPFNNYTIYDAEVGNYVKGNIVAGKQDYSAIRFESGEPSDPPQVMRLLGNYPNPFTGETTIAFSLTTENVKHAEITIYNIRGQKIENLQITNSPNQEIIWDASKFASGVYLYKLVVDGIAVDTKKMILLN
ncbi:MAG: T9SS type A sorting domain-containing protein, partial [Candidatus Cloacimonetes bacterium]|nr:T9SS type A sorting domain-containing protein [Candidatus Cloacimonadota bacterium]